MVKHMPEHKNGGADALSQHDYMKRDVDEDDTMDNYFDTKLYSIQLSTTMT